MRRLLGGFDPLDLRGGLLAGRGVGGGVLEGFSRGRLLVEPEPDHAEVEP